MNLFGASSLWTKEACISEAHKYHKQPDFMHNSPAAYTEAKKQGLLPEIEDYFDSLVEESIKLKFDEEELGAITLDDILSVASRFENITSFKRGARIYLKAASLKGYLPEISSFYESKSSEVWDILSLYEEAIALHPTYDDLLQTDTDILEVIKKKACLADIYNLYHPEWDYASVEAEALKCTSRDMWKEKSPVTYCWATQNRVTERIAGKIRDQNNERIAQQKRELGLLDLSYDEWTRELVGEEIKKHKTLNYFRKHSHSAYRWVVDNDLFDELCSNMHTCTSKGYWTKERLRQEIDLYDSMGDFLDGSSGAYHAAWKNGWLKELTSHLERRVAWEFDSAVEEAKKYETLAELSKEKSGLRQWMDKNELTDKVVKKAGITRGAKKGSLTKEYCHQVALKYKKLNDFRKNENSVELKARREGWYDEITNHLERTRFPKGYWSDKERCYELFKFFGGNKERVKNEYSGCMTSIRRNGWIMEFETRLENDLAAS